MNLALIACDIDAFSSSALRLLAAQPPQDAGVDVLRLMLLRRRCCSHPTVIDERGCPAGGFLTCVLPDVIPDGPPLAPRMVYAVQNRSAAVGCSFLVRLKLSQSNSHSKWPFIW